MKKWISMMLVLVMLAGVLTGCGTKSASGYEDTDGDVTLVIALQGQDQKDADAVVAKINEKLETLLPNTKIELLTTTSFESKWPLWMATGKAIDLAPAGDTVLEDEVRKESFLPLDDLVADYAPTLQELSDTYWNLYDSGTINGTLYAVPNIQLYAKTGWFIDLWKEGAQYMDLAAMKAEANSSDKTTEGFWKLLSEGLDKAASAGVDCAGCINLSLYSLAQRGYTFIGGTDSNICYENSGDGTIIDYYTTNEFKTFCSYMKTWAEKGYVSKDILTGQWSDKTYGTYSFSYSVDEETGLKQQFISDNKVSLYLENPENTVLTTDIGKNGSYWAVPYTSENPVRAIKFLNLLHSEEGAEIANLLAYGIEGEHYEFVDEENGDIKAFEYESQPSGTVSYGFPNWYVGNMLNGMYQISPFTHEMKEWATEYYASLKNMKKHPLYGFTFDTSAMQNEFSQILKNNKELATVIYSGTVADGDAKLQELLEKNKAAGQEKVIETVQKAVDEFMASK